MDTRLLLVSHASTAAQRTGRFPADDPLDARGLAEAHAARARLAMPDGAAIFVSPAVCARDTALALGLSASIDANLADMNYGKWQGRRLADLAAEAPQDLAAWTRDPDAAPHGGESFSQLVKRVGAWLDASNSTTNLAATVSQPRHVVAVTHAPVLRAAIVHALGASPMVFAHIEIAPLSVIELRHSARGWTWWPAPH
ncbi:phosphoglycerate mutase [Paraburkholderia ginsengiterrae]|uniref:Phosphoglycerate mutase n=1 Tax=Paraburkholderia ginsengiterrae TaxID=1462993 RepID=A0A1A9MXV4_9BURK|nr:histidine phosphatase family protein [Paraburkholderia ginsengiterrae]OAJ52975.1 phosphoglycerate mutase [Paraburkholderia ginsengiterrae]OAJ54317.1 phosphoglycerate mutase [Paraburkholderia ginsengiterrae]